MILGRFFFPPAEEEVPPGLPLVEDVEYADHGFSWKDGFCASRDDQSPINLDQHQLGAGVDVYKFLEIKYPVTPAVVPLTWDGSAIKLDLSGQQGAFAVYGGRKYLKKNNLTIS